MKKLAFQNSNALLFLLQRIIKSGFGAAFIIDATKRKKSKAKITLIIYDKPTKDAAKLVATDLKVPYYPFQSIPDYIISVNISFFYKYHYLYLIIFTLLFTYIYLKMQLKVYY